MIIKMRKVRLQTDGKNSNWTISPAFAVITSGEYLSVDFSSLTFTVIVFGLGFGEEVGALVPELVVPSAATNAARATDVTAKSGLNNIVFSLKKRMNWESIDSEQESNESAEWEVK